MLGENPDAQDGQAEEEEEDNEEEDDAGVEDAADANNGAQGSVCPVPLLTLQDGRSFLACTEHKESSAFMFHDVSEFCFDKLAVRNTQVHKVHVWGGSLV